MTERVPLIATDPLTKSEGSVAPVASPISQSPATCVFQVTGPALLAIKTRLNNFWVSAMMSSNFHPLFNKDKLIGNRFPPDKKIQYV